MVLPTSREGVAGEAEALDGAFPLAAGVAPRLPGGGGRGRGQGRPRPLRSAQGRHGGRRAEAGGREEGHGSLRRQDVAEAEAEAVLGVGRLGGGRPVRAQVPRERPGQGGGPGEVVGVVVGVGGQEHGLPPGQGRSGVRGGHFSGVWGGGGRGRGRARGVGGVPTNRGQLVGGGGHAVARRRGPREWVPDH